MFVSLLMQIFPNLMYMFLHATSPGSFPKALSSKEEADLLKKMFVKFTVIVLKINNHPVISKIQPLFNFSLNRG